MAKKESGKGKPDKPALPIVRKVGRPTTYSPEIADTIFDLMVEGMDMVEACKALGLNRGTVYRWKDAHPDFESLCARAREAMMEKRLSDLRLSIKDAKKNKEDPTWFRVELSFEQWNAERVAPRLYAPKNKTEVTGKDGAPIQLQQHTIIDSRNLSQDEREMLRQVLLAAQSRAEGEEEGDEE